MGRAGGWALDFGKSGLGSSVGCESSGFRIRGFLGFGLSVRVRDWV